MKFAQTLIIFCFATNSSAALFSGSYFFEFATAVAFGQPQQEINNNLRTDITVDLVPGAISITSFSSNIVQPISHQYDTTVTSPITFASVPVNVSYTVNEFSFSSTHGTGLLESNGPNALRADVPETSRTQITIAGFYSISGPTETVTGDFSVMHGRTNGGTDTAFISVAEFPDAIQLTAGAFQRHLPRNSELFTREVDGVEVTGRIDTGGFDTTSRRFGRGTDGRLEAVPEPSTGLLLVAGGSLLLLRNRKTPAQ